MPVNHPPQKKSLGQHFLSDDIHLSRIVAAAELTKDDTVLEIGPGPGTLTRYLAAQADRVIAVELDNRLIEPLRSQFANQPHVEIVHGDILEMELKDLLVGRWREEEIADCGLRVTESNTNPQFKIVANLPYYITSAVLRHILEASVKPTVAVLMVQKEVGERIVAQPGDLSLLAISVQFYSQAKIVHRVPASAFRPPPKVDSAVLRLDLLPGPAVADVDVEKFFDVVRAGFSQKRKQLLNSLSAGLRLSKAEIETRLHFVGIDPKRRAETLSLQEWGELYRTFL
ncbi:MAG: 16S rRNA (adenine(1518)-N(6)/adenine(1519)-N(6))-dimethyltransferase RsmA [Caldilineaceae bacterium]